MFDARESLPQRLWAGGPLRPARIAREGCTDGDDGRTPERSFSGTTMDLGLGGLDLRAACPADGQRVLMVTNTFSTGFDEPLLRRMSADRTLSRVTAVQTPPWLHRA